MRACVTGGAGFIGSAVCRHLVEAGWDVLCIDSLTYAGNLSSLASLMPDTRFRFVQLNICDVAELRRIVADFRPDVIFHTAAETHVDRSIDAPAIFIETNVIGTHAVLEAALAYWRSSPAPNDGFRFLHLSTDEVFGQLGPSQVFTEMSPYAPRSPYAASKAASDHLVRAWAATYGLPVLIANCSNNYGPRQFPEKLIPLTIINAMEGKAIKVYGDGLQIRDWLHVEDTVSALMLMAEKAPPASTFLVGGRTELTNLHVVQQICSLVDELSPGERPRRDLIEFVSDRPGHDRRYATDCAAAERSLGWRPTRKFDDGLRETVRWYLDHREWWTPIRARYAGERLGLVR